MEVGDPGRAEIKAGFGFNQRCQKARFRCGYVSGYFYVNQYFRYDLINRFNSKRTLKDGEISRYKEDRHYKKNIIKQVVMDEIL